MERLLDRNTVGKLVLTPLSTAGVEFVYDQADDRTVFVATGSGDITVVANGPQGVNDYKITVNGTYTEGDTTKSYDVSVFTLDSYFFKGSNGKVTLKGASTIKVGVIALP